MFLLGPRPAPRPLLGAPQTRQDDQTDFLHDALEQRRFEQAYRLAWDVRRFTGSRDINPLLRALDKAGLGDAWVTDRRRRAVLSGLWRSGVESETRAWHVAHALA